MAHAELDALVGAAAHAVLIREPAVGEVVVEVVARAARLVDRRPVRLPELEDVVARDGIGQRLPGIAGDAVARAVLPVGLKHAVMEDVAPAVAPLLGRAGLGERAPVVLLGRPLRLHAAALIDVAEDVHRPPVRDGGGDAGAGLVEVVAPDAHVPVPALGLDRVVPDVRHHVAVDVAVGVGEARVGEVVLAADAVVVVVPRLARDLVVADYMVAAAAADGDALRAERVAPRPAVRAVARLVDAGALNDHPLQRFREAAAIGAHAGIAIDAHLPARVVDLVPPP